MISTRREHLQGLREPRGVAAWDMSSEGLLREVSPKQRTTCRLSGV